MKKMTWLKKAVSIIGILSILLTTNTAVNSDMGIMPCGGDLEWVSNSY